MIALLMNYEDLLLYLHPMEMVESVAAVREEVTGLPDAVT